MDGCGIERKQMHLLNHVDDYTRQEKILHKLKNQELPGAYDWTTFEPENLTTNVLQRSEVSDYSMV